MSFSTAGEVSVPPPESDTVAALAATELHLLPGAEEAGARSSVRAALSSGAIRVFDVVVAGSLLLVLLPLMAIVAVVVRMESTGPAFFRCERMGYQGRRLRMLKLRKMTHEALGGSLTTDADIRFTRIGGLLSKLKIDEIPQLLHVLDGSMSLVGPRPEVAEFVSLHAGDYTEILSVRPGITGLSQIAFIDERRILDPDDPVEHYVRRILPQKVGLDRLYANRRSLSFNMRVLYWTAVTVLLRRQVAVHRDTGKMNIRRR